MSATDLKIDFLASAEGQALLALARSLRDDPPHRRVEALRQKTSAEATSWLVEQDELMQRAERKCTPNDNMLFDRTALEQATAWDVATHRAEQWPDSDTPIHDLCAGLGIDAWAAAKCGHRVIAYEMNRHLASILRHNVSVWGLSERIDVRHQDCLLDAPYGDNVYIDPDRRAEGDHNRRKANYAPAPETWDALLAHAERSMLKLAIIEQPSEQACGAMKSARQNEWISLHGRARERRVYIGDWKRHAPLRATTLPSGKFVEGVTTPRPMPGPTDVGAYLLDPDISVVRAGLVGHVAATHSLHAIHRETSYLVGEQAINELPGHWLRIDAVLPHQPKAIRKWLRDHDVGRLTIRKQGIHDRADVLQKRHTSSGSRAATLVFTRGHNGKQIVIASLESDTAR